MTPYIFPAPIDTELPGHLELRYGDLPPVPLTTAQGESNRGDATTPLEKEEALYLKAHGLSMHNVLYAGLHSDRRFKSGEMLIGPIGVGDGRIVGDAIVGCNIVVALVNLTNSQIPRMDIEATAFIGKDWRDETATSTGILFPHVTDFVRVLCS